MYSYGSPHMAAQKQDDQLERTFSSYVRIQDVVLKTYLGQWTIGRNGERGSGISVLPARYDDDDDDLTTMDIKTVPQPPYRPDFAPCNFLLLPNLRGCRYETSEDMKEAGTKVMTRSHKRTCIGPSRSCLNGTTSALQPEEMTSQGTRVSCVYYQ